MRHSNIVLRTSCMGLLGLALLLANAPTQAPAATSFAPTISAIPGPADSLVCGLMTDARLQLAVATAGQGQLERARQQAGISDCGANGPAGRWVMRQPRERGHTLADATTPPAREIAAR